MSRNKTVILLSTLFMLLSACQSGVSPTAEATSSATPTVTNTPTPTPTPIPTLQPSITNLKECIQQSSIDNLEYPLIIGEPNLDLREENFKEALDLHISIIIGIFSENYKSSGTLTLEFNVFFINNSDEVLIVRIPPMASNEIAAGGLLIEVKNSNDQYFYDLNYGVIDYYPKPEDFVQIPPNSSHCANYSVDWIISETGLIRTRDGNIVKIYNYLEPGKYFFRAMYLDISIGYEKYDLNSWVGRIESNWVELNLP